MRLIGVDVGGTFTDIVFTDTESNVTHTHKVASTPDDPSRAFMRGVTEICNAAGVEIAALDHIYHGTTIATNAALQYRGARAGMITTRGFRDIVHIGRHQRPQHYSLQQKIPWQSQPLVQRRHRKVVTERLVPPRGEVEQPLDEATGAHRCARAAGGGRAVDCGLLPVLVHQSRARAPRQGDRAGSLPRRVRDVLA
jgi:N-methylhydantoinase A/oxoprolinase/acetone carboxylase beta subunit